MTALPSSGSFAMVDPTHVAEVGPAAAILFARIAWRSRETGEWTATRAQLGAETGLSPAMIRTAVEVLRDREWVTTRRVSTLDSTLTWIPIHAGHAERLISPSRDGENSTTPPAESAIPSIETGKKYPLPPEGVDGALFPVAAPEPTPASADGEPVGFADWYGLYPKKAGRKAAARAYAKAVKSADPGAVLAGLRRQLPSMQRNIEEHGGAKTYIKDPATWLNKGCWLDEVDNVRPIRRDVIPSPGEVYDRDYEATLPPPLTDPFARGVL